VNQAQLYKVAQRLKPIQDGLRLSKRLGEVSIPFQVGREKFVMEEGKITEYINEKILRDLVPFERACVEQMEESLCR